MGRFVPWFAVVVAVGSLVAGVMTFRSAPPADDVAGFGFADAWVRGEVAAAEDVTCPGEDAACVEVVFEVTEGPDRGTFVTQTFPTTIGSFERGDSVFLAYSAEADPAFAYGYADRVRTGRLLAWGALFAVAVVALGRWKGVAALIGVGVSVAIILGYVLPTLLAGGPPVLVAVVAASVIAAVTFVITHGATAFAAVAYLGTVVALALTAVLSELAFATAWITGLASEEATYLTLLPGVDVSGLILAGAVLGALGALDDVTITQTSTVWELRAANPDLSTAQLRTAGLRVGRDHIASTVNTLVLAYAGAAMPILVLFVLSNLGPSEVMSSEVIAVEVLRTVVGSIGLIAAVPITTWLAAIVARSRTPEHGGGHVH